jgi:GR25 family glycosyltransferase involved in LPS biosynthesis
MQTFVINLDSRQDRLNYTTEQLKDIPWNRFPAVCGYGMTAQDFITNGYFPCVEWKDPILQRDITNTEIALSITNFKIWEKSVELNENVLILEDDNIYHGGLNLDKINKLLEIYDIVYLDYDDMFSEYAINVDDDLIIPGYPYLANAYAISTRLCKKLVSSNFLQCIIPIDEFLPMISGIDYEKYCLGNKELFLAIKNFFCDLCDVKIVAYKQKIFQQIGRSVLGSDIENGNSVNIKSQQNYILTVGTDFRKMEYLHHSTNHYTNYVTNIGIGVEWGGGDMSIGTGGGQKINLVKKQLEFYSDDDIVLFVDGYDVFFVAKINEIIDKFKNLNCDILFASEINCWPDKNLANKFDEIHTETRYKYLNSGLYIGTVKHLKYIMQKPIENNEDDQLYFQNRFLENLETQEIVIKLDCDNYIFQCLSGIGDTVGVLFKGKLINIDTCCCPLVVHGNGGPQDKFFFDKLFRKFFSYF